MLRKKSEKELAADRAAIGRLLSLYKALVSLPAIVALVIIATALGYALGYWDGYLGRPSYFERKDNES